LIRVSPMSAGRTSVECEYYKHRSATSAEMEEFLAFGKQVQKEVCISTLCTADKRILTYANSFNPI
jgi:hypothetical protein